MAKDKICDVTKCSMAVRFQHSVFECDERRFWLRSSSGTGSAYHLAALCIPKTVLYTGKNAVEVRAMTAREEDILTSKALIKKRYGNYAPDQVVSHRQIHRRQKYDFGRS